MVRIVVCAGMHTCLLFLCAYKDETNSFVCVMSSTFHFKSCDYGDGKFWVTDDNTGEIIYENDGNFGEFVQVTLEVNSNGEVQFVSETADFDNSWEGHDAVPNYPQAVDQTWPGPKPDSTNSLFVNVKFDRFPEELSWELSVSSSGGSWTVLESFDGGVDGIHNDLVSIQVNDLEPNWYRLVFKDSGGDGICCAYRRGWMAVTGYILATRRSGLVWGNNGEFGESIEVYLQVNSAGMVNRLTLEPPTIA